MAYIALHGRSVWASLNTFYAALLETDFKPDSVWIVTESAYEDQLRVLGEGFEIISIGFDLKPKIRSIVLPEGCIVEAGVEIGGLVDHSKETMRLLWILLLRVKRLSRVRFSQQPATNQTVSIT